MLAMIDCTVQARLITEPGLGRQAVVVLRYYPDDPFAVRLGFPSSLTLSGREIEWVFGRELLTAGLRTPSGIGDVHVWPCGPGRTMLELCSPEGSALLQLDAAAVRAFLRRSYQAVPGGGEGDLLQLEFALAAFLDEAGHQEP